MNHGKTSPDGSRRYCNIHGEHGFLYPCKEYPQNILEEVINLGKQFKQQCENGTILITNMKGESKMWKDADDSFFK